MTKRVNAGPGKRNANSPGRPFRSALGWALLLVASAAPLTMRGDMPLGVSPAALYAQSQSSQATPKLSKEYVYAGGRLVAIEEPAPPGRVPYPNGEPHQIPGTVQAEDFDEGGEGISYHDVDPRNSAGTYRAGGVYIENCGNPDGGCNVGSAWGGEWLEYTVDVASAGTYEVLARVASGNGGGGTFRIDLNGSPVTGALTVPPTGGWQIYQTVTASVTLPAGVHVLRLTLLGDGPNGGAGNYNYFKFTPAAAGPAPTGFLATARPGGGVTLTWDTATQATPARYEVERTVSLSDASPYMFSCATAPCEDASAAGGGVYFYRLRVIFAGGAASHYTQRDVAGTMAFADDPLNPNGSRTVVRAVHFTELRDAVNALRSAVGLQPFGWTGPAPRRGDALLASHYNDLRASLGEAMGILGLAAPRSEPARRGDPVTHVSVQELRNLMR